MTLILFNKPYQVMCQFTPEGDRQCLKDYIDDPTVYPAGRLDFDSEGLVVLTNNGKLQSRISHPKYKMPKTYYVQVDGQITDQAINALARGVQLKDSNTKPARAAHCEPPVWLWPRTPAVRYRKHIPTSWIQLSITEGRNRQVRRMTAAVGFPTLRLIRTNIGPWSLGNLAVGAWHSESEHSESEHNHSE
jgi:23S rRNA pseudouridine2457 synthase